MVNDSSTSDYDGLRSVVQIDRTNIFLGAETWVNGNVNAVGDFNANTYYGMSDRTAKTNFTAVDTRDVLQKVVTLPITAWNFKKDDKVQHLGPMAQDFYAAFNLGKDDKHIATVDEEGVALAAIQGLNQKLETENAKLKQQIIELGQLVNQLSARINGDAK